ncbi:MAG: radical SAM protein [Pseudomonadota bacterium]
MTFEHPKLVLHDLDNLWFQVGGTLCNLTCEHCFISCGPGNHSFEFMPLNQVKDYLDESLDFGVKEYYFTGGEPFMNPQILDILDLTMNYGPVTVLTNGTLFNEAVVDRMAKAEESSLYSLEVRVSLDGPTEEMNDTIRGKGAFKKSMRGIQWLIQYGFLPIITVTKTWAHDEDEKVLEGFYHMLRSQGYDRHRIKILPPLKIGREMLRDRGYTDYERVTSEMLEGYDLSQFLCFNTRVATSRGVYVCPILIEEEEAHMGKDLREAKTGFVLKHHACFTCYLYGAICSNLCFVGQDA